MKPAQAGSDAECTMKATLYHQIALELAKKKIVQDALDKAVEAALAHEGQTSGSYDDWWLRSYASSQLEHMNARQYHNAIYRDCLMAGLVGASRRKIDSDPKMKKLGGPTLVDVGLPDLRRQGFPESK